MFYTCFSQSYPQIFKVMHPKLYEDLAYEKSGMSRVIGFFCVYM